VKSGKEQSTKQRAAGLEKSQDHPTHTELKTLKDENVINTEEQQQSSSSTAHDIDRTNFDSDNQLPVVDALVTVTPNSGIRSTLAHVATVKQLQESEQRIKHQATCIEDLEFRLRLKGAYQENLLRDRTISSLPSAPPAAPPAGLMSAHELDIIQDEHAIQQLLESLALKKQAHTQQQRTQSPVLMVPESPGPHRLQPRPEWPQDVAYRKQQLDQAQAEQQTSSRRDTNSQDEMMNVFKSLTKVLSDINKQLHSNDVSDPPKFNGQDSHWDDWYLQWRTFLEAKG
jgi:hypothetical protein